jgi:ABC-type polysaccharide/polyol phosphate transport system ATPase subunit
MAKIELRDINLTFRVRQTRKVTLKEYVLKGMFSKRKNPYLEIPALRDITLELHDGDRLGVIGHNGAGKSTLLKLIAGIYPPTSGWRDVRGAISSLFDISLGFELDANGWDNIRYRAYLQGETPQSIAKKIDRVAEYSELGDFLNMPVRYYSAGMLIRLAFSIASAIEPEILLIDEVLAAGDLAFQVKAQQRMKELMSQARLMVLISHGIDELPNYCTKVAWMDHGKIVQVGPAESVVAAYKASVSVSRPMPGAAVAA